MKTGSVTRVVDTHLSYPPESRVHANHSESHRVAQNIIHSRVPARRRYTAAFDNRVFEEGEVPDTITV